MMRHINIALIIIVLVVAVILSTIAAGQLESLKGMFLSVTSPFVKAGTAVEKKITPVARGAKTAAELEAENAQLLEENKELHTENQIFHDLEKENKKLREALDYRERSAFKLLPARVVSHDASAWWNTVKINRGFEDGVEKDMTVLTENGLVGKTTTIAKNESIVLLLTDENCKVAAKIDGTHEQGITQGKRVQSADKPELQLNFLTKNAPVQEGQKVFTAGVSGGVFPSSIPLGTIKSFHTRELDTQAIVTPAVDIPSVEDVFVVMGAK